MKRTITCLTAVTLAIGILTCLYKYDQRKANASDLILLAKNVKTFQAQVYHQYDVERLREIDKQLFTISQRYPNGVLPIDAQETKHRLQIEMRELKIKLGRK